METCSWTQTSRFVEMEAACSAFWALMRFLALARLSAEGVV